MSRTSTGAAARQVALGLALLLAPGLASAQAPQRM
jgi:hypothetical protein